MIRYVACGLTLALAASLPFTAHAHRAWMLPSTTILSGDAPWVTVDAAVSNELFSLEHHPLVLDGVGEPLPHPAASPAAPDAPPPRARPANRLLIMAPDGSLVTPHNGHVGKYRSVFDLELAQKGTYRLAVSGATRYLARYTANGEDQRRVGPLDEIAQAIPAGAEDVQISQMDSRMEVFITSGQPSEAVLAPTGTGLELQAVTHPNDLFAGETSQFRFLLDGEPVAGVDVTVIPGGVRHRDRLNELKHTTNSDGMVGIEWPTAGFWWLEARLVQDRGLNPPVTQRRATYSATLEVMAP